MARNRFSTFAWGVFAYGVLVILWGYFLRISRSGDGCGTDWPLCHGALVPQTPAFPTLVEYVHRFSSGIVLLLVAAMVVWAFRAYPRGHVVRLAAAVTLLLTVTESLFGAFLVVFGLVADDASLARVLIRPFHVTNTFLLLGALALTPWWASRPPVTRLRLPQGDTLPVLGGAFLLLLLGWTGSWTGLANAAFPAESLQGGLTQYLHPEHFLVHLRVTHPVVAVAGIVALAWLGLRFRSRGGILAPLGLALTIAAGLQALVGPLAVLLREAISTRLLHLLLADAAWVLLLFSAAVLAGEGTRTIVTGPGGGSSDSGGEGAGTGGAGGGTGGERVGPGGGPDAGQPGRAPRITAG